MIASSVLIVAVHSSFYSSTSSGYYPPSSCRFSSDTRGNSMINHHKYGSISSIPKSSCEHPRSNEDVLESESMSHRRKILQSTINLITTSSSLVVEVPTASNANANDDDAQQQLTPSNFISRGEVFEIKDPNTYSAVVYIPPPKAVKRRQRQIREIESYPLLVSYMVRVQIIMNMIQYMNLLKVII